MEGILFSLAVCVEASLVEATLAANKEGVDKAAENGASPSAIIG